MAHGQMKWNKSAPTTTATTTKSLRPTFCGGSGAPVAAQKDHGRRRRNQTKSKGDARVAGRAGEGISWERRAQRGGQKEADRRRRRRADAATSLQMGKSNSREPHEIKEKETTTKKKPF